ncbi:hypothetical protein [Intestinibacillus massiliensis]|uniref:hypothetical protein n=1 Tax=Intestinibacillus massiliensis TaxID=1871029 RepID=UPI000B35A42D|nr:hypothetical protein [Intestinibacillus massiliensis]
MRRFLQYYRDPGNRRRLVGCLFITVMMLYNLYATLKRTFWYTWVPPAPSTLLSRFLDFLPLVPFIAVAVLIFIYTCGASDAPWRVKILELLPALLIGLAGILVQAVYRFYIT